MLARLDLPRLDLRGRSDDLRPLLPRARLDVDAAIAIVRPVIDDVRDRGAAAVVELTERFDGVRLSSLRVEADVLQSALRDLDPTVRAALEEAIERARRVHEALTAAGGQHDRRSA